MFPTNSNNHRSLFVELAQGDERAFRSIFAAYSNRLSAFVFKLTKSEAETAELVQEIFIKLWSNRNKLHDIENHEAYLFTMASNRVMDHLRKVTLESRLRAGLWERIANAQKNDIEEALDCKESEYLIHEAVVQLSPQKQKIFTLSRQEGWNHEKIAHHLQLSKSTVKNHLVETLRHIRSFLHRHSETLIIVLCFQSIHLLH